MEPEKTSPTINSLKLYTKSQLCSVSSNMWSRPATVLLIEMYRKLECLWKTTSIYYRNKRKRHDALNEIATALAPFRPDTTTEDVKNKINGIRTQYVAEKNKVAFYAKSNPPLDYEPTLWCYDRLSFLAPYTSLKIKSIPDETNTIDMISNNEDITSPEEQKCQIKTEESSDTELIEATSFEIPEDKDEYYSSPIQFETELSNKRRKIDSNEESGISCDDIIEDAIQLQESKSSKKVSTIRRASTKRILEKNYETFATSTGNDNWIDIFGKFVSSQMKLITDKTLLIQLQHTIQNAIMDTQLKQIKLDNQ